MEATLCIRGTEYDFTSEGKLLLKNMATIQIQNMFHYTVI